MIPQIRNKNQLSTLTIRQLKALAMQMNRELGTTIAKPLSKRLGHNKTLGEMKKVELIDCIWYVRNIQLQCPEESQGWEFKQLSKRVFEFNAPTGEAWVHYVGFDSEQAAYKQYQFMMNNNLCTLASIRKGKRTGYKYEVKYWGVNPKALAQILRKDEPAPEPDRKWNLETRIGIYNTIIANGGVAGLTHVTNQITAYPELAISPRNEVVLVEVF